VHRTLFSDGLSRHSWLAAAARRSDANARLVCPGFRAHGSAVLGGYGPLSEIARAGIGRESVDRVAVDAELASRKAARQDRPAAGATARAVLARTKLIGWATGHAAKMNPRRVTVSTASPPRRYSRATSTATSERLTGGAQRCKFANQPGPRRATR
jgi:hypothetical protein